jgi:DNA invertase Pin-like site-specific DNA recombinase
MREEVLGQRGGPKVVAAGKAHRGRFVAYYRVSTDRQGKSGLGLDAQREAVKDYLNGGHWTLIGEFTEVESGRSHRRPMLDAAIGLCKEQGATLVIAKLDRLYRNAFFVNKLYHDGVDFVAADQPYANKLTIQILASVAEHEAELISERTRAALAAVKRRGKRLGSPKPEVGGFYAGLVSKKTADEYAAKVMPIVRDLRKAGCHTLREIAEGLERHGVATPRGGLKWWPSMVNNLLKRSA